ncbi:MAG: Prophage endopeptidase tail [Bacteroidetes bacterium ADurb.BinA012]|nr:MAG: Prophage endopeptidase tail [Bacteroidetes bacterium ADurb.BinA012]
MTKAMTMTIKRAVSTVVAELNPLTSSTLVKEVMGEEQITLAWEQASFTELLIGDYIEHEGSRWTMNTLPTVKKTGTHSFRYDAVFQSTKYDVAKAVYMLFDNTPTPPKGEFSMTGNATMFMELLVANLNRLSGTSLWSLGQVVEGTEYITLTFSNEDCLSVLGRLADEFNTEYHVTNRIIHLKRFSTDRKITLKYGSSLYDIERVSVDSSGLVTRLYPYGSTRNLPGNYRGGSMPLCLPDDMGQYLESLNASNFGIVERSKSFDEIYPRLSSGGAGVVTDVGDALTFKDSALDFDVNDCLMDGTEAKVHFITGQCAGYDFEIQRYNHATKTFTLIPNQQENDFTLPTGDIRPAVGDKYVLLDIVMPDSYRLNAEQELADKASEWLEQNDTPKVSYRATFSAIYARQNLQNVECGDTVRIEDADMGIAEDIRIVKLTKGIADYWTVQFDLSDTVTKTTLQHIIGDIATVQNDVVVSNQMINENARRSYLNNKELREMVFDTDGYFDPENIKPLSIETSMLSVGARAQAFQLSILLQPNYAGNAQVLQWSAGLLAHFTMDDESVMEWALPAGSITITGSNQTIGLYIYAKCSRTASSGTLFLDAAQRKFDADPDYWYFLVGVLHSPVDGVRGISLTYGQTTINGRFIKTGRVQSADGNTFFDLDSGTIQGNIRFQSGQTVEAGIQEAVDGIEIGGRNLLLGTSDEWVNGSWSNWNLIPYAKVDVVGGKYYTGAVELKDVVTSDGVNVGLRIFWYDADNVRKESAYGAESVANGASGMARITAKAPDDAVKAEFVIRKFASGGTTTLKYRRSKLESGKNPTDWTPAPEDVQADIEAAQGSVDDVSAAVDDLETYVDGAFLDGVIDSAEAIAIGQLILTVQAEADAIEATYNKLYTNPFLSGTPKTNLLNAKITFVGSVTDLIDAIDTAIADGQITAAEHTNMNAKFALYNSALASFSTAIEAANQAIQQALDQNAQGYVDNIEIGGRNLLAFADMIQGATSGISGLFVSGTTYITSANYIQCIGASLTIGAPNSSYHVHVCFFDESQIFITSVYLLNGGAYQSTFPLTWIIPERTKFIKITVKRSDGGVVTPASVAADCRIKIELGNKPTDWTPAPEDVQANIDALGYLKEALNNNTDIQGGLLSTTLIKLGAVNQSGSWVEKAGINGAGTTDNTPRIYAGGTLQQAINRIAGQLTNAAKFVVTQAGKIYAMDVELFGSLSTAPPGGKRIFINQDASEIQLIDDNDDVKAMIGSETIPSLSSLLSSKSVSVSAVQSILFNATNTNVSQTKFSNNLVLPSTSDKYNITTPPINFDIECSNIDGQRAWATVRARLITPSGYVELGMEQISLNEFGYDHKSGIFPAKTFNGMPYGTYKVELWGFGEGTSSSSEVIVQLNISTPNDTLSGGAIVEISRINNNGMFIIYDANNYLYQNPNALKEKMQTAPDRPGFLLSGRGVSSGGTDALWGAKKHASKSITRVSAGTYTVYHSIGHTDYSAIVSVMDASRSIRWADPQTDSFTVYTYSGTTLTDANFSFAVFGNN